MFKSVKWFLRLPFKYYSTCSYKCHRNLHCVYHNIVNSMQMEWYLQPVKWMLILEVYLQIPYKIVTSSGVCLRLLYRCIAVIFSFLHGYMEHTLCIKSSIIYIILYVYKKLKKINIKAIIYKIKKGLFINV